MVNTSDTIEITAFRMIDWHTHILPGMDDGSKNPDESVSMLKKCHDIGVTSVVLTPHFYPHKEDPEKFSARRSRALNKLWDTKTDHTLPDLIPGAEVCYFNEIALIDNESLSALGIGESRYIMLELPFESWNHQIYDTLEALIYNRRIIPVLAHIDRYFHYIKDEEPIKKLVNAGMLVQLNVDALEGFLTRRKAIRWIKEGMIHILASDCHNMDDRPPNLDAGIRMLRGRIKDQALRDLTSLQP